LIVGYSKRQIADSSYNSFWHSIFIFYRTYVLKLDPLAFIPPFLALTEEIKVQKGRVVNPNFRDYNILTANDRIPVEAVVVEKGDEDGPYGAKGIGEPGLVPTAPAIANAIYDAIGVRITELPITPERVLDAIKAKEGGDEC